VSFRLNPLMELVDNVPCSRSFLPALPVMVLLIVA
jgi:hypothetical protein